MRFVYPSGWSNAGWGVRPDALRESVTRGDWRDLVVRRYLLDGVERHPEDWRDPGPEFHVGRVRSAEYDVADAAVHGVVAFDSTAQGRDALRSVRRRVAAMAAGDLRDPVSLSLDIWSVLAPRDVREESGRPRSGWFGAIHPRFLDVVAAGALPARFLTQPLRAKNARPLQDAGESS
jgi:hypothetical protein